VQKSEYGLYSAYVNCNKYLEISDYAKLVTPLQNLHLPVYRWFSFKHSFSRNLVIDLIKRLNLTSDDTVLDPFIGSGTTLLACKEMGINAIGLDLMPLSVFISNVKIGNYDKRIVEKHLQKIDFPEKFVIKSEKYSKDISKYFPKDNLRKAAYLKEYIDCIDDKATRDLLNLAFLSIMEEISYARKDGAFVRIVKDKVTKDPLKAFNDKVLLYMHDIDFLNLLPVTQSYAKECDARDTGLEESSITSVITSPPYPNRHDYTRIYYLELVMGFYSDPSDIKKLRYSLIRSHVEAREKYKTEDYTPPANLVNIVEKMKRIDLPNRNVIGLVEGYFKDMHIFLQEMKRILRPDGTISLVIGDSRYGGINVPAGELVIEIAKKVGFDMLENVVARDKGNSPQQMGKFGKTLSKESVIILKKQ
jgi:DNA modification methylase